jgi:predicted DsbA family dithiol-disulfide isomerase
VALHVTCWSDLCCPWCWLGRDRTELLQGLGATVTVRPYELHPEIPASGRDVRPGGRLAAVFAEIERECVTLGRPFRAPDRVPNTNRALRTLEFVHARDAGAHDRLEDALYRAVWVDGLAIDDPDVLDRLTFGAGMPAPTIRSAVDDGEGADALARSMADAHAAGVAGTPAWVFGEFVLPGVQPRPLYERIVAKLG